MGLFLAYLPQKHLWYEDEARVAEVAREMARSGDYLIPRSSHELEFSYPPLVYWLICLSAWLCGRWTEAAVTLPSVAAAVGCVLLTCRLGTTLWGRAAGFWAGLLLLTMNGFTAVATFCRADMIMFFFQLWALLLFAQWHAWGAQTHFPWVGFSLATGLAVLAKGPQGLVVTWGIVIVFLALRRELRLLLRMKPLISTAVVVLVAAPWHVYAALSTSGWDLLVEHLDDFLGPWRPEGHVRQPHWLYLAFFLARSAPWFLFLPAAIAVAAKEQAGRRFLGLFAAWFGFVLLFYSLAAVKRFYYVTLLYPALALVLAKLVASDRSVSVPGGLVRAPAFVLSALLVAGVSFLWSAPGKIGTFDPAPFRELIWIFGGVLLVGAALFTAFAYTRRLAAAAGVLSGLLLAAQVLYSVELFPALSRADREKGESFCGAFQSAVAEDLDVYFYECNIPPLAFYLARRTEEIKAEKLPQILERKKPFALLMYRDRYAPERFPSYRIVVDDEVPTGPHDRVKVVALLSEVPR